MSTFPVGSTYFSASEEFFSNVGGGNYDFDSDSLGDAASFEEAKQIILNHTEPRTGNPRFNIARLTVTQSGGAFGTTVWKGFLGELLAEQTRKDVASETAADRVRSVA